MRTYRRALVPGASYFFTLALAERDRNDLLVRHIEQLRNAFRQVRAAHPFTLHAIVVLPEHLHCIWELPEGDADYATRWRLIKTTFSRAIPKREAISPSRARKHERGLWQRRYWEHVIRDEADFGAHLNYVHYNPVKHGLVSRVCDWPYSSFHRHVEAGRYEIDWGLGVDVADLDVE